MSSESTQPDPTRPHGGGPRRPADHHGPFADAWAVKLPDADAHTMPDQAASLQAWLIYAPASHPHWQWYFIGLVYLRDIPGVAPAHLAYPDATHELLCAALDPDEPIPDPDKWRSTPLRMLHPIDQVHQFDVPTDEHAMRLGDLVVIAVCKGVLIPDQDHRAAWQVAVSATAEHIRQGAH